MTAHREDAAEQARLEREAADDGLETCEHCEGRFDSADMIGDHCRECEQEIFGDADDA